MSLKMPNNGSRRAAIQKQIEFSREVRLLLEKTNARTGLLVRLLWQTGITPSELVNIKAQDLNTATQTLSVRSETTKNGIARTVKLTPELVRSLATLARATTAQDYLFSTRQSTQLCTRRVEQVLKEASEEAGLSIRARDLRNDYISRAVHYAKDTQELKELTGLKTIQKDALLSEQEETRLARVIKQQAPRDQALLLLLSETGMHLGEALSLQKKQLLHGRISLPERTIILSSSLSSQLNQFSRQLEREQSEKEDEYLFSSRQSTQLGSRRSEQLISYLGQKAGIENLTAQRLRATSLHRIAQEQGIAQAKEQLGLHATLRYRHGLEEEPETKTANEKAGGGRT
jgi:integrase